MALETPISAWQPPIAADSVAPFLNTPPDHPGREQERLDGRVARIVKTNAIQQHGRDHARRPVGRRRDHAAERRVLLVDRQREAAHPLENLGESSAPLTDGRDPGIGIGVGTLWANGRRAQKSSIEQRCAADDAKSTGQHPLGVRATIDALAHHRPDLFQASVDRCGVATGELVSPDDFGDRQPVSPAVFQQVGRRVDGKGQGNSHIARPGYCVAWLFLDHETAADRIIGLGV